MAKRILSIFSSGFIRTRFVSAFPPDRRIHRSCSSTKYLRGELAARVVQCTQSEKVVISSIYRGYSRLCALELRLAEFNDGTAPQLVPGLGQAERLRGLSTKLIGHTDTPERGLRIQDRDAYITGNGVGKFLGLFFRCALP